MALTSTHDGKGNVTLYGGTATHDNAGNVVLTVTATEEGAVIAEDEISLSLVDTSGYATKTELTQTADSITATVKREVADIEVGGRNLLTDSDFSLSAEGNGTAGNYSSSESYGVAYERLNEIQGEQVVLSLYMKTKNVVFGGNGSRRIGIELSFVGEDGSAVGRLGLWKRDETDFDGRLSAVLTVPTGLTITSNAQPRLYAQGLVSGTVEIARPKLEKGNKATDWTPAPEDMATATQVKQTADALTVEIDNAAKTATNFMSYDSSGGLQVGNKTSGSWSGFRTQITSSAFNILNSSGTVLASYGAKLVELGKNAADSVISLCGGKGTIKVSKSPSGVSALSLGSDNVGVRAEKSALIWSDKYEYTEDDNFFYDRYAEFKVDVDPDIAERHKCQIGMVASEHVYQKPIGEGLNDTRHSEFFVTPFEIYGFGDDVTFASRNGIAFETVAGDVTVNGRSYGVNKVLFSGAWYGGYSGNTGTITLSEAISSQPHGIVLVFGEYRDGAGQDSGWSYFFVPKQCVDPSRNGGTNFATHHYGGSTIMAKYLYIRDTTINGWANNGINESGYHSNSSFVLRYVIGV